jgi:hypothetical protein
MPAMPSMPGMTAMRPLTTMLRALGYAAVPAWPAGLAAAIWWTGRAEMALLSVAGVGTSSALVLAVLRWAEARLARRSEEHERLMAMQAAEHERVTGKLCDIVASDLRPRERRVARTLPDLRIVR